MSGVNIFLSYRRDDSGHAGRLFDHLGRRFPGNIFRDITGIAPGSDFVKELERKLDSCHVLLVIISKTWLMSAHKDGRRRLEDEGDFVRLEVAAGLRRDVCVIPVLVNGAVMPSADDLPRDLKALATRQAMEVSERDFEDDVLRLCQAIERKFGIAPPQRPAPPVFTPPPPPKRGWLKLGLALGGGAFLMFVTLLVLASIFSPTPAPNGPTQTGTGAPVNSDALTSPARPAEAAADATLKTPPAATQTTSQTTTAAPAAAAGEFFSPAGSWRISRADAPGIYVIYHLKPGRQVTVRFNVANLLEGNGQGQWSYDSAAQQLVVWGTLSHDGSAFREVVNIVEKDGDVYAVQHTDLGDAFMSRE